MLGWTKLPRNSEINYGFTKVQWLTDIPTYPIHCINSANLFPSLGLSPLLSIPAIRPGYTHYRWFFGPQIHLFRPRLSENHKYSTHNLISQSPIPLPEVDLHRGFVWLKQFGSQSMGWYLSNDILAINVREVDSTFISTKVRVCELIQWIYHWSKDVQRLSSNHWCSFFHSLRQHHQLLLLLPLHQPIRSNQPST